MLAYVKTNAKAVFQNRVLANNELVISTNGDEVDYISNGKNEIYSIIVEKNLFLEIFLQYYGEPFNHFETQNRFFIKPHILHYFIKRIVGWMTFLKLNQSLLLSENKYAMIESNILTDIFDCLIFKKALEYKKEIKIKEVRDFLHTNVDMNLSSMSIAKEFGISQRHMERIFKKNYGISPKRYLLNLRMSAVRKELLLSHPKKTTISDIILKYNFFDLNYFSKAYKLMYHELPSKTLNR
jgi:AraC-like DNA-binding protein